MEQYAPTSSNMLNSLFRLEKSAYVYKNSKTPENSRLINE
jgi:hypothetical protein